MQASCVSFKNFQHDPAYSHDYRSLLLGILSFLLRVITWTPFCKEDLSLLFHLFIWLVICLYQHGFVGVYFILWVRAVG